MKKGVSLVEMLVVVGIIAIVATITIPLLGIYAPSTRLSGDAKVMVAALRKVQHLSMSTQKRYGIKFYQSLREYRLFIFDFNEETAQYELSEIETVRLSTGVNFDRIEIEGAEEAGDPEIYFDAFGAPKNADDSHIHMQIILVNSKGETKTIDIRKNTGHVKSI